MSVSPEDSAQFKVFMYSLDIYQLFMNKKANPKSFGIVLSPRGHGLKALLVHLTKDGFDEVERSYQKGLALQRSEGITSIKGCIIDCFHELKNKLYC